MATADDLAKLRIAEETKKIIAETNHSRKLKQRQLIGEAAEDISERKDHVDGAKKDWNAKGTQSPSHGREDIERDVASHAKQSYQENVKKNSGKSTTQVAHPKRNSISKNLKGIFAGKQGLPSLFSPHKSKSQSVETASKETEDFVTIERQEEKIVGTSTHITTTGIDAMGRRLTRTKIVLQKNVGETKIQHQDGVSANTGDDSRDVVTPMNGQFYSLADIRQRKVPGIDKNHREHYLSPEEFEEVFRMPKEEFAKLPKWKRDKLKRDLYLF